MAYGNWGAFVFREGERMPAWEDNTPFRESEALAGYWQAFARGRSENVPDMLKEAILTEPRSPFSHDSSGFEINPHHAVLGDKALRLCGYKSYPRLYNGGAQIDMDEYVVARAPDWKGAKGTVQGDPIKWEGNFAVVGNTDPAFDGTYRFAVEVEDIDYMNTIAMALVEPDGTRWTALCGYCIGAGHQDDGEARDLVTLLPKDPA
ncbi:MAG: hypothetical protein ABW167_07575 [Baekduia sp.]